MTDLALLLIEDSADDADLIALALRRGGFSPRIDRVETLPALDEALRRGRARIVLCDYQLVGFSGLEALDLVRRRAADLPFIFVSGRMGEDVAVEAMRSGAQDYVTKDHLARLAPAIARELADAAIRARARDAQAETRATQARLAEILEIAADAIISVDDDQHITVFNRGAEQVFGYAAQEVLGASLAVLLPAPVAGRHAGYVREFGQGSDDARRMGERAEVFGRRKDGTEFPAEASISRVRTDQGFVYTVILRDITERRRDAARLASYARDLERTNRELQEYAYAAAHDLRAPLRNIASFAQLLRTADLDLGAARRDEYLAFIESAAGRLQQLLAALLEVDRVSRERRPLTPVNLVDALTAARDQLHDTLKTTAASVRTDGPVTVWGDAALLVLLFQNLLENAVKFTAPGCAPDIEVSHRAVAGGWQVTVRDHGIGVDPDLAGQAFELFRRLHTGEAYPGNGLGLAICRRIVEDRHGGRIWMEPAPGGGTAVHFILPERPPGPGAPDGGARPPA